jgi:glycosyltransferase involved in cell wall biosynthesis
VPASDAFRHEVVGPDIQGILWENVLLPRAVHGVDVLFGPSYTIPLLYRGPTVVATHSVNEAQPGAHGWSYRWTYTPWYRSSARRANRVIVPSEATRKDVQRWYGVPEDRIDIAREGVDEDFKPVEDPEVLRRTREKYFGRDRPYLLFVGKQSQRRNIPDLIRALGRLKRERGIPHGLLLMGPNVLGRPLAELTDEAGVVDDVVQVNEQFPDHTAITKVYSAADAYVYPSAYDGFSLTVVEAMACGLPVVTADRAALSEIGRGCAELVSEPTEDQLTDAIWRVLSDRGRHAELRARGLERATSLQWEGTARRTLDVLRQVAETAIT